MGELDVYFSGHKLYGDDFSSDEINEWYSDEAEGYANLGSKDKSAYGYAYHQLNSLHAFKFCTGRYFNNVLGIGSAYGDEFDPISKFLKKLLFLIRLMLLWQLKMNHLYYAHG